MYEALLESRDAAAADHDDAVDSVAKKHRLVDRHGPLQQSSGTLHIEREGKKSRWQRILFYWSDLFHTLVDGASSKLFLLLLLVYMAAILMFALAYWMVSPDCNVDFLTFGQSYLFSVETIMTIGFSASDPFFGECASMSLLITAQSLMGVLLDSICFGLVFQRLARAQQRARTIIFSRVAVIDRGKLMFRVAEARRHMLVESHVRVYAVTIGAQDGCQQHQLRVSDPDDNYGAMLFMLLPTTVVVPLRGALAPEGLSELALLEKWTRNELEIVVMVEGIEPVTSCTIMARYSYLPRDLRFNCRLLPCVDRNPASGKLRVNFDKLHEVEPLGPIEEASEGARARHPPPTAHERKGNASKPPGR